MRCVSRPGAVFQTVAKSDLAGRELEVTRPGDKGAWHSAGKVELSGQEAVIRYRGTEQPGAYRFRAAGSDAAVAAFAVQIDARESDLKMLPADKLAALTTPPGQAKTLDFGSAPNGAVTVSAGGTRRALWLPLLIAAAVVALIEMILAQRFSITR